MKQIYTKSLLALALSSTIAHAGTSTYSQPLTIERITFGSTGNMYLYPYKTYTLYTRVRENNVDPEVETRTEINQVVPNPAGCASPSRLVLKNNHPLYEILVNRTHTTGGSKYYGGSSGTQYYVSGTQCEVKSPVILRLQESATQAGCDTDLAYQYATDDDNDTRYSCYIEAFK